MHDKMRHHIASFHPDAIGLCVPHDDHHIRKDPLGRTPFKSVADKAGC